ncbi:DUF4434 domain-containing protein [candidate division KSB1 bacterium]|nr:DUF4434 domain-containing protein [candidate division KSB1 bacterium]
MNRKKFLKTLGTATVASPFLFDLRAAVEKRKVKPIEGSWFEFQHHNPAEGKYWNETLANFTCEQWDAKIKEIAAAGLRYLVLLDVAIYGKSFYPSALLPQHELNCDDPLEAILAAADRYNIRFFLSNGFFGDWYQPAMLMQDADIQKLRLKAMHELVERYSHHKSFYGWYYPNETGIVGHYDDFFIDYVNTSTAEAAKLTPEAKTLIAPYGTRNIKTDDRFIRQLEQLNVDYIAYQDEIGVEKTRVEESAAFFERLYKLHKKAAKSKLWADVEVFRFEGKVYDSALLPAPAERVIQQLEAVSPYVEKILIYQYLGMLNKPGSKVFAGHPDSDELYQRLSGYSYLKS